MATNPWDDNALLRHKQITQGKDVSLTKVLAPTFVELIGTHESVKIETILDLGCGTGALSATLLQLARRVIGLDSSPSSIAIAKEHNRAEANIEFVCADILSVELQELPHFQVAVANMVLQTLPELRPALVSIATKLTPMGALVISIPHPCFWASYKGLEEKSGRYHNESAHVVPFTITNDPEPLPSRTPYFHRPLQTYAHELYSAGFVIEDISEPFPDESLMAEYSSPWLEPHFILLYCRKRQ
jgi:trans-aconitate methyltransferase